MAIAFDLDTVKVENHKIVKETEKAICVEVDVLFSSTKDSEVKNIWIPKSQIKDGRFSDWIICQKAFDIWKGHTATIFGENGRLFFSFARN